MVIERPKSFALPADIASEPVDGMTVAPVPFMVPAVQELAPPKATVPLPLSAPPLRANAPEVVKLLLKLQVPLTIAKFAAGAGPARSVVPPGTRGGPFSVLSLVAGSGLLPAKSSTAPARLRAKRPRLVPPPYVKNVPA